jgi:uncharacterized protein YggE
MRNCLIGALVAFASVPAAFADETPPHTIVVMGEAEINVPPDFATVAVGVVTQGQNVSAALAENNVRMSRVVEALKALGLADANIQTSKFDVQPKYEKRSPGDYDVNALRPVVGYAVSNKVVVTVTDMSKIAKIIDASVQAGANDAGEMVFSVKNPGEVIDRARHAAIDAAYHKAEIFAAAAHMNLGPAISITDNEANYSSGGMEVEQVIVTGSRLPATPISAGGIPVKSRVTVVYDSK